MPRPIRRAVSVQPRLCHTQARYGRRLDSIADELLERLEALVKLRAITRIGCIFAKLGTYRDCPTNWGVMSENLSWGTVG